MAVLALFLADLVISGGVVTGLDVLDYGSSYLYTSLYYLEITGTKYGHQSKHLSNNWKIGTPTSQTMAVMILIQTLLGCLPTVVLQSISLRELMVTLQHHLPGRDF